MQGFTQSLFGIFSEEIIFPHNIIQEQIAEADAVEDNDHAENGGDQ